MVDETVAKEAVNTALMAAQEEYTDLERTAVSVCQELEGEGAVSGSSGISHLRVLGGRIAEHAKSTFASVSFAPSPWPRRTISWTCRECRRGMWFLMMPMQMPCQPSWMTLMQPPKSLPWCLPRSSKTTSPR